MRFGGYLDVSHNGKELPARDFARSGSAISHASSPLRLFAFGCQISLRAREAFL
jgi:hypothetical protein